MSLYRMLPMCSYEKESPGNIPGLSIYLTNNHLQHWGGWIRTTDLLINSQKIGNFQEFPALANRRSNALPRNDLRKDEIKLTLPAISIHLLPTASYMLPMATH